MTKPTAKKPAPPVPKIPPTEPPKPPAKSQPDSILDLPLPELEQRVAKAHQLLTEVAALLPGLRTLTEDDRLHTSGKLRDGESEVLARLLPAIDRHPAYFASLADQDEGHDPTKLETGLIADRLARRELLATLLKPLSQLSQPLADTALHLGEQTRPVLLAAYRIARTLAKTDSKLRDQIAPIIDFYSGLVKRPRPAADKPTP
jgi:hypothetical protein